MVKRYLAYSNTHGVYLGGRNWSKTNPEGKTEAPTFLGIHDAMKAMEAGNARGTPFVLVMAFPQAEPFTVPADDVPASGLPTWDPNAPTVPARQESHPTLGVGVDHAVRTAELNTVMDERNAERKPRRPEEPDPGEEVG